jgi:SpoVK/Ycf46/Vps4 family AAA+-type ATPase
MINKHTRKIKKNNNLNPTTICKYNKFLSTLDNKFESGKSNNQSYFPFPLFENDNKNEDMKKVIDGIIANLENDFTENNIGSINFTGQTPNDINMSNMPNPNDYICFNLNNKYSYNKCCKNPTNKNRNINNIDLKIAEPTVEIKKVITIDTEVNSIGDILKLIETYKLDPTIKYNINMTALHNIKEPLEELDNMIGMKDLKTNIVDQILYFVQELHKSGGDFMHSVIYGPPGTGKTEIAKIMGKIYSKLGILSKGTFKKVKRSDLIAGYLGQTAIKTMDVIKEAIGGVLFIDEAYSLGNTEKRDIFAKECIDTLCEALSDNKGDLMVIICGYENELKECFFDYNQGLDSRFTWRFKTDDYTYEDLYNIFLKKIREIGWEIDANSGITSEWFKKNKDYLKFYGRDIETILAKTKIMHSKRVFCKGECEKKKIILKDLEDGFKIYLKNENVKNRKSELETKKYLYNTLYS